MVQIGPEIRLNPLGDGTGTSTDYQTVDGTTLWGKTQGNEKNGDPASATLTIPDEKTCGDNYIPIRAEVRVAGVAKSVLDIDNPRVRRSERLRALGPAAVRGLLGPSCRRSESTRTIRSRSHISTT